MCSHARAHVLGRRAGTFAGADLSPENSAETEPRQTSEIEREHLAHEARRSLHRGRGSRVSRFQSQATDNPGRITRDISVSCPDYPTWRPLLKDTWQLKEQGNAP